MRVVGPAKPNPELAAIEVSAMRGLEIGPLANPRIRKSDGQVFYLDRSSTEELRSKYAENETLRPHIGSLVDVDFVQRDGMNLSETVGSHAPFDYVVASHVVEHIPNLIGWLQDVASVLRVGGILALVVPDKRYCFDTNRTPTEMSDLVDSHLRQLSHPSYRHIYDNFSRTVTVDGMVDTVGLWEGTVDYAGTVRSDVPNPGLAAFQMCLAHRDQPDTPIDIHCHAFTPESFLRLLGEMMNLDLITFEVATFAPTRPRMLEFYASLRKIEESGQPDEARERMLASIPRVEEPSAQSVGQAAMMLSPLERRLIATKRHLVSPLHHIRNRLRR